VPVLNEEAIIRAFLERLRERAPGAELVVVDGGSSDKTREAARFDPVLEVDVFVEVFRGPEVDELDRVAGAADTINTTEPLDDAHSMLLLSAPSPGPCTESKAKIDHRTHADGEQRTEHRRQDEGAAQLRKVYRPNRGESGTEER
jgi:glycosyltransferase involved in cell wall biosynthesis